MSFPSGIGAVDLMIGFPFKDKRAIYEYLRAIPSLPTPPAPSGAGQPTP